MLGEGVRIEFFDERFTSVLAHRAMIDGGMRKMARRDKAIVDEISATIILNDYLAARELRGGGAMPPGAAGSERGEMPRS